VKISGWLICALWLALLGYWGLSARAVKQSMDLRWIWWREIAVRLGLFALVVQLLQLAVVGNALPLPNTRLYAPNASMLMSLVGLLVSALGIGLAILARAHLARTWGVPMASKENPELVTTGPYALVRHPIYSGMLLAMVGSAIGQSVLWLLPLVVYGPNFIRSARREEKLLLERFPDRYRAYMKRTRMLLPLVL
jgi:protein-S-isoprenylcysteine O-methyltransferase Ste14